MGLRRIDPAHDTTPSGSIVHADRGRRCLKPRLWCRQPRAERLDALGGKYSRFLFTLSAALAVFVVGNAALGFDQELVHWWTDCVWTAASFLAGTKCLAVGRRAATRADALAWLCLGFACLAWFAGMVFWDYSELVEHVVTPFPGWADAGYLAAVPFFAAGLFFYCTDASVAAVTPKKLCNFATVFLSLLIIAPVVLFDGLHSPAEGLAYIAIALAYPVLYVAVFAFGCLCLCFYASGGKRFVLLLVVLGIAAIAFANVLYAETLLKETYESGSLLDVLWLASFAFIHRAAFEHDHWHQAKSAVAEDTFERRLRALEALTPGVATFAVIAAILFFYDSSNRHILVFLAPVAVAFALSIGVREWWSLEIAARLKEAAESAAEQARRSEERFRDFASISSDWFWEQDSQFRFTHLSGSDPEVMLNAPSFLGKTPGDLATSGADEEHAAYLEAVRARLPFRDFRRQWTVASGRVFHVSISGRPIFDAAGNFQGYRGTARDITAAVAAETALRESEARYRLLADYSSDVIMRGVLNGPRLYVSPSLRQLFGHEPADLIGGSGFELVHPDDAERVQSVIARMVPDVPGTLVEYRMQCRDGSYLWVEVAMRLVSRPDGALELIGSIRDMTVRRRTQEALRESEALNRSIVESSIDCIKLLDLDGKLLFMNGPGLYAMEIDDFGPFVGRHCAELWSEGTRSEVVAAVAAAQAGGTGRIAGLCATAKGTPKWWDVVVTPVLDGDGNPKRLLAISRDVTTQKENEIALRVAKEEAEAANRIKSEFLANMSHELRTPLNAIIGFSQIIRDAMMGPISERYQGYGHDIHSSGAHLLGLINDVLDLSKVEVGLLELQEEPVDLAKVLRSCNLLMRDRATTGGVKVAIDSPPGLPPVLGDEMRLKQIILNLLTNAVKFTPSGGKVTVSVEFREGEGVSITVKDTGIGMTDDELIVALEPFRQIDSALSRRYDGTGLGLPLTKRLVELHGGVLRIHSEPAVGTEVRVDFPAERIVRAA
jgi:PAS domain S-box-containing protein